MRPIYETMQDVARQRTAMARLCHATGTDARETPPLCAWDYEVLRDGSVVAIAEVKCRLCSSLTYPTYMISLRKMDEMGMEAAERGITAILVVAWQDRTAYLAAFSRCPSGGRTRTASPVGYHMERKCYSPPCL
jgi:hypothetical protein